MDSSAARRAASPEESAVIADALDAPEPAPDASAFSTFSMASPTSPRITALSVRACPAEDETTPATDDASPEPVSAAPFVSEATALSIASRTSPRAAVSGSCSVMVVMASRTSP